MLKVRPKISLGILVVIMATALSSCEDGGLPEGFSFSFAPKGVTIPATGGSATVTFSSPATWVAEVSEDWVQISPKQGSGGECTVTVSIGANPAKDARSAMVKVSLPDFDYSEELSVTQLAYDASLKLSESSLQLSSEAGTGKITVSSTVNWTAAATDDWFSFSPAQGGFGDTEVTVTVTENTVAVAREGSITFTGEGETATYTVSQSAAPAWLRLSASEAEFSSKGGSLVLTLTSNSAWSLSFDADWATVSASEGPAGETQITIAVDVNESVEARSAALTFNAVNENVVFTLRQKGLNEVGGITGDIGPWEDGGEGEYGRK